MNGLSRSTQVWRPCLASHSATRCGPIYASTINASSSSAPTRLGSTSQRSVATAAVENTSTSAHPMPVPAQMPAQTMKHQSWVHTRAMVAGWHRTKQRSAEKYHQERKATQRSALGVVVPTAEHSAASLSLSENLSRRQPRIRRQASRQVHSNTVRFSRVLARSCKYLQYICIYFFIQIKTNKKFRAFLFISIFASKYIDFLIPRCNHAGQLVRAGVPGLRVPRVCERCAVRKQCAYWFRVPPSDNTQ